MQGGPKARQLFLSNDDAKIWRRTDHASETINLRAQWPTGEQEHFAHSLQGHGTLGPDPT